MVGLSGQGAAVGRRRGVADGRDESREQWEEEREGK
jgi:hypothetical protein